MKESSYLYYYTIGYEEKFIDCLFLSIQSLRKVTTSDIMILSDEKFVDKLNLLFPDVIIHSCSNTTTPEEASIRKLCIFDYNLDKYDTVIFLDSDILIHTPIDKISEQITNPELLYVYTESQYQISHKNIFWSLRNYTEQQLSYFSKNKIKVFNAGIFGFKVMGSIKMDFNAVRTLIKNNTLPFFYEQSFMNYYFNLKNNTDRSLFTDLNYKMFPKQKTLYRNYIIHFCGTINGGDKKYLQMKEYNEYSNSKGCC